MAKRPDLKSSIKKAIGSGIKQVQLQREKLQSRREELLDQAARLDEEIAALDSQLRAAVEESLREFGIVAPTPAGRRGRRKRGEMSIRAWVLDVLKRGGAQQTEAINRQATTAGLNPKTVAVELSKLAKAGEIKARQIKGKRGRLYSA